MSELIGDSDGGDRPERKDAAISMSPAGQQPRRADIGGDRVQDPVQDAASDRAKVVVCDADQAACRHGARVLAGDGFEVSQCETAAACQELVVALRPSLVVLSILLPDLDGLALARRLAAAREDGQAPRILIVSVLQAEQRVLEAGADGFLLKPASRADLVAVARRLVGPVAAEPHRE